MINAGRSAGLLFLTSLPRSLPACLPASAPSLPRLAPREQHLLTCELIPVVTQIELAPAGENSPAETTDAPHYYFSFFSAPLSFFFLSLARPSRNRLISNLCFGACRRLLMHLNTLWVNVNEKYIIHARQSRRSVWPPSHGAKTRRLARRRRAERDKARPRNLSSLLLISSPPPPPLLLRGGADVCNSIALGINFSPPPK